MQVEMSIAEYKILSALLRRIKPVDDWVRVGDLKRELKLNDEQVRYRRKLAEKQGLKVARQKKSGQYEYNLALFKEVA